jgi:hypothetical protein
MIPYKYEYTNVIPSGNATTQACKNTGEKGVHSTLPERYALKMLRATNKVDVACIKVRCLHRRTQLPTIQREGGTDKHTHTLTRARAHTHTHTHT